MATLIFLFIYLFTFFFKIMNIFLWSVYSRAISIDIPQHIESGCSVPGSGDARQFQTSAVGRALITLWAECTC